MWRTILQELVATGRFGTQKGLVQALAQRGFPVNQGSVSRELKTLRVRKVNGRYATPAVGGLPDGIPIDRVNVTVGGPIAVLHTRPAHAPRLAQAIDFARIPGVLGTLAGDDTVFVACAPGTDLGALSIFLGRSLTAPTTGATEATP